MLTITRGLSSVRKNLLCSKGYTGAKIVLYPSAGFFTPAELREKSRLKRLELVYNIQGILSVEHNLDVDVLGVTSFDYRDVYIVKSRKQFQLDTNVPIYGAYIIDFLHQAKLSGQVLSQMEKDVLMEGLKEYLIEGQVRATGRKQILTESEVSLLGIKSMTLIENLDVSGKRDIITILEALDLL